MSLELDRDLRVHPMVDVQACLFLHLTSSTSLSRFMLVPLSFGKTKFVSHFHYKNLCIFPIENDGAAYRFVLLQSGSKLMWIDPNKLRTVLFKFEEELISLTLPFFEFLLTQDQINIIIESLLRVIAESAAVSKLLLR